MLTLLTATGARPEAWAICERLMLRQDYAGPFYRYTQSGLRLLLEDAGFVDVQTANAGEFHVALDDHGGGPLARRAIPIHVFAVGRRPA